MWIWVYDGCVNILKSILVGVFSLIAGGILLLLIIMVSLAAPTSPGTAVGIDIVSVARSSPLIWIFAVMVFSLGFHWEYRRLKLRQAK
jgi:hypothetical protein